MDEIRNNRHNHLTRDIKPLGQCPSCDEYHKIEEIKSLMQKHDWFFEYSDDHREWQKGWDEKLKIIELMRKIPMNEIPELLKLVPEPIQKKWYIEFQLYATAAEVADAVLDHNRIQTSDGDE